MQMGLGMGMGMVMYVPARLEDARVYCSLLLATTADPQSLFARRFLCPGRWQKLSAAWQGFLHFNGN